MSIKDKNRIWLGGVIILFIIVEVICLLLFSPDSVSSCWATSLLAFHVIIWALVLYPKKSPLLRFFSSCRGREFWIIHDEAFLDYSSNYDILNYTTNDFYLLCLNLSLSYLFSGLTNKENWLEDQVYKRKIIKKGRNIREIVETKEGETISFINEAVGIDGGNLVSKLTVKFEDDEIGSFVLASKVHCKGIEAFPKRDNWIDIMYVTDHPTMLYMDVFHNLQWKPWIVPAEYFEKCAWGDPHCGCPDGLTDWNDKDADNIRDMLSRAFNRTDSLGRKLLEVEKDGVVWCYSNIFYSSPICKCPGGMKIAENIQEYRKLEKHYTNIYWHRFVILLWIALGHLVAYISVYAAVKG